MESTFGDLKLKYHEKEMSDIERARHEEEMKNDLITTFERLDQKGEEANRCKTEIASLQNELSHVKGQLE